MSDVSTPYSISIAQMRIYMSIVNAFLGVDTQDIMSFAYNIFVDRDF